MNIDDVMRHLTPGELDAVKQAYRQGFDWRKHFGTHAAHLLQISTRSRSRLRSTTSQMSDIRFRGRANLSREQRAANGCYHNFN